MLPNQKYFDLQAESTTNLNSVQEFLMRSLLGAREEAGIPSNEWGFDEDVNVYLVGLLGRFFSSGYHEEAARYHFATDLDLAEELARTRDDRHRYRVYRTNADHLLLAIGLLRNVAPRRPHLPALERAPEDFVGRGETYYELASSSLRRLQRRSSGTEVALTKLASHFADYASILGRLRTSYFHLTARLSEGQLFHLLHDPVAAESGPAASVTEGYDRFLDAFSAWKQEPGARTLATLNRCAEELKSLDPGFAFELPAAPDPGEGPGEV